MYGCEGCPGMKFTSADEMLIHGHEAHGYPDPRKEFSYGACVREKYVFVRVGLNERRMSAADAERMAKELLEYAADVRTGRERVRDEIEAHIRKHG